MENSGASPDAMVPPIEGLRGGGTGYGWGDMRGMHNSIPAARSLDPAVVLTEDLLHVWVMPSTATVLPQEMPLDLEHISLLAARNERESLQVALRPKVSWGSRGSAGTVQFQCTDLCSTSGDRLVVGESLSLYQVVPVLGIPDALVPVDLPVGQICLHPGETSALWFSVSVPPTQPPGKYEGEIIFTAKKADAESPQQFLDKEEKHVMYTKLKSLLDMVEHVDGNPLDEVDSVMSVANSLRGILLSPSFCDLDSDNGFIDSMEEDPLSNIGVHLNINLTVWDFVLPVTPSLPVVLGISDTVIEDRLRVEHGSHEWQKVLELHFKWLLQYRVSPYFCRWSDGMRVSAYTCPWPADHPKSDEYLSDPRLAAYAVPYDEVTPSGGNSREAYLRKEVEILRTKPHWNKAYFYLWDEPLNMKQYDSIRIMASEIYGYSADARVLTTYYSGPSDSPIASSSFESFVKVPQFLRPYTQIYCTSQWVLGNREDLVNDIVSEIEKDKGEEWWTYVCLGPSDPHPNWHLGMRGTQHRAVMWRVWKEGATGFLYWGANCYEKATVAGAEIKFRRGLPPGDGVLFYPGEVFSCHRNLIASVRLERILCGLQDIEYLNLYSSRYCRAQAVSLLERTGVYLGPEQYTSDHMAIDVMRGEIFSACRS